MHSPAKTSAAMITRLMLFGCKRVFSSQDLPCSRNSFLQQVDSPQQMMKKFPQFAFNAGPITSKRLWPSDLLVPRNVFTQMRQFWRVLCLWRPTRTNENSGLTRYVITSPTIPTGSIEAEKGHWIIEAVPAETNSTSGKLNIDPNEGSMALISEQIAF